MNWSSFYFQPVDVCKHFQLIKNINVEQSEFCKKTKIFLFQTKKFIREDKHKGKKGYFTVIPKNSSHRENCIGGKNLQKERRFLQ